MVDDAAVVEPLRPESAPPSLLAWVPAWLPPVICKQSHPAAVDPDAEPLEPIQPTSSSSGPCGALLSNAPRAESSNPSDTASKPGADAACDRPTASNSREEGSVPGVACVGRGEGDGNGEREGEGEGLQLAATIQLASSATVFDNASVQPDGRQHCVVTRHSKGVTVTYSIVVDAQAIIRPSNCCTGACYVYVQVLCNRRDSSTP